MSESNSSRLTHKTFFIVCECLKKNKTKFLDERPTHRAAALMLTELCGVPVSESSIAEIKEAAGVEWICKKNLAPKDRKHRTQAIRTLATALRRLYNKFDEEVPKALEDLYNEETGREDTE